MRNIFILLSVLSGLALFGEGCKQPDNHLVFDGNSQFAEIAPDGIPFTITDHGWNPDSLGNHRVLLEAKLQGINRFYIPWRRPDLRPQTKRLVLINAQNGSNIDSVSILDFNNEFAQISFRADTPGSRYYLYYLPYKKAPEWGDARYYRHNDYIAPDSAAQTLKFSEKETGEGKVIRFESRRNFDYFTSMGIIATKAEEEEMARSQNKDMVLFAENRAFPIRLPRTLPYRWIETGPVHCIEDQSALNEYYTYQIGVWAPRTNLKDVSVRFTDLKNGQYVIPASAQTCFNKEGTNWDGQPLHFQVDVPIGEIQALWCGVDIPENIKPGTYTGQAIVSAQGVLPQEIEIILHVKNEELANRGDNETWRHSRLRWLNSTLGTDDKPTKPYAVMTVSGNEITATGKTVLLGSSGLPEQIKINDKNILDTPIRFIVETSSGEIALLLNDLEIQQTDEGKVLWKGSMQQDKLNFTLKASMEFDGYLRYNILVDKKGEAIVVKNIRLDLNTSPYSSAYFMGAGVKGGYTPTKYSWDWKGPYDSFWIGNALCGLHIELRGGSYHGPLINDYKPAPPAVWSNDGHGGITLQKQNSGSASIQIFTGLDTLSNTPLDFEFGMLITPVKQINTKKHFSERYYHKDPALYQMAKDSRANIINIHHAQKLNPVINYPWIVQEPLKQYIDSMHQIDMKVKLYYTIRELTTHAPEVYALKSLKHEIFVEGPGYGLPWTCEHLIDDYKPAWFTEIENEQYDAALVVNGFSRWINYYLEGLKWMLENYQIDGIYMDDVSFNRTVLKRMRKIMDSIRPGALIDLHSNTGYSVGPENQYADFMPYIDRTWFGESYKYDEMAPDEWFVTFSSIPMGNMSEMLQDGGNPYLGMVYGTTGRLYHTTDTKSPIPMWKLWEDFNIENADMIGYWDEQPVVMTNHKSVKATAFYNKNTNQTLVVVGNFKNQDETVSLQIDRKRLNLPSGIQSGTLPDLGYMQQKGTIDLLKPIHIPAKKAIFFILK